MSEFTSAQETILASRPRLDVDVGVYLQKYRGVDWFLLVDPLANTHVLIDHSAYRLLETLEHHGSVTDAMQALAEQQGITCSVHEVEQLLLRLHAAGMLKGDLRRNLDQSVGAAETKPDGWLGKLRNPLSIRVPLVDPDRMLSAGVRLIQPLLSLPGMLAVLLLLLFATLTAARNWALLEHHWDTRFLDPGNLLLTLLLYPMVKVLHELGHGLVARRYGAEIHEMGVLLLVFFPVPYVDATATATLNSPRHRMAVSAAGIVTELGLAALAIIGWQFLEPGLLKDACFNVAVLAGTSTLLFNGNPLLRFDGYYVLLDAVQIPNLGSRASEFLGYLFRSRIMGLDIPRPMATTGEARWLVGYGVLSGFYRLMISLTIAFYVAGRFFVVGMLLAIWFVLFQILRPYLLSIRRLIPLAVVQAKLPRVLTVLATLTIAVPVLIWQVPIQRSTAAYGVVVPPESALIRSETAGFVEALHVNNGDDVMAGQVIASLRFDELEYIQQQQQWRLAELEAEYRLALFEATADVQRLSKDMEYAGAQLAQTEADMGALRVVSPGHGRFSSISDEILPGRWVERGSVIGMVATRRSWHAQVMVAQASIERFSTLPREILAIRLSEPDNPQPATLDGQIPRATHHLPQASLGSAAGGPLSVDISDPSGIKLLEPMFQINIVLPEAQYFAGQTILVWFLHESEPLGTRLWAWLDSRLSLILK